MWPSTRWHLNVPVYKVAILWSNMTRCRSWLTSVPPGIESELPVWQCLFHDNWATVESVQLWSDWELTLDVGAWNIAHVAGARSDLNPAITRITLNDGKPISCRHRQWTIARGCHSHNARNIIPLIYCVSIKTCDHIFNDNLKENWPFSKMFGTLITKTIGHRHVLLFSHLTYLVHLLYLGFRTTLWTKKTTWTKAVDDDASGLQICLWPRVTLTFDLLHPTQWAFTITCACQDWLKFVGQFLKNLAKRDFCDLFQPCTTLTFDLLAPKVDHFTLLSHRQLTPICRKICLSIFKISCSEVWLTDKRKNERSVDLRTERHQQPVWPEWSIITQKTTEGGTQ